MKKILLFVAAIAMCQLAMAQAKVDLRIARLIEETKAKQTMRMAPALKLASTDSIRVLSKMEAEAAENFMSRSEGYDFARVTAYAGGVAVVKLLTADIERLQNTPGVTYIEYPFPVHAAMDKSRPYAGVDLVQQGTGLPDGIGFDGTGVTVIVVDTGFDFNHAAFRDKDGNTRIKTLALRDENGNFYEVTDPQEIAKLTTDMEDATHGTHTTSMAAGTEVGNGHGGVAPGADIIMVQVYKEYIPGESDGIKYKSDADIAFTLEAANKAYEISKRLDTPNVISMSFGNVVGARDGSDLASQFMNAITQGVIFFISASNNAYQKQSVHHTFAKDGETATICLYPYPYLGVQFFADNDKPFTLSLRAVSAGKEPETLVTFGSEGAMIIDSNDADNPLAQKMKKYFRDERFRIEARGDIYHNGKYFIELYAYDCMPVEGIEKFQLEVSAGSGTHVDGHIAESMGAFKYDQDQPNEMVPDDDGSINSLACGTNAISVGAMVARATAPLIDGRDIDPQGFDSQVGDIAPFSSWMTYPDGTSLPHLVAPGYNVVAGYSSYDQSEYTLSMLSYPVEMFGRECPYGVCSGTSMSTPFVSGTVALWLQANGELTRDEVLDIMKKTAKTTSYMEASPSPAQWGMGVIDAYGGMKEALKTPSGISDAGKDAQQLVKVVGDVIEITTNADRCDAVLYNAAGSIVARSANGTINIASLPRGVYILTVNGGKGVKIVK